MIGAASAAIVGGTASVLGGGKFANGAQTAAIQYLFNQVSKPIFSGKYNVGKLKLSVGIKNVFSYKFDLSLNAVEQVDGLQARTVNGLEVSGELRGVEYKLIDVKEYNSSQVRVNNSFQKNVSVKGFSTENQDVIYKAGFGAFIFGYDVEVNFSEMNRRMFGEK